MTDYDCRTCNYRNLCESRPHSPCFMQLDELDKLDEIYENYGGIPLATFCDFELIYHGEHSLDVMMIVRDNMTISGLLELSYIGEHYIHLCVHRFNDEYYQEMITILDAFIKKTGGEYEIISEDDMDCRVNFSRYFPKEGTYE